MIGVWIEAGTRPLDLVDSHLGSLIEQDPSYRLTHVYGNVLIESDGQGNSQIFHHTVGSTDCYNICPLTCNMATHRSNIEAGTYAGICATRQCTCQVTCGQNHVIECMLPGGPYYFNRRIPQVKTRQGDTFSFSGKNIIFLL